jgi:DNA repair protein RecN (Recombination protein N)
MLKKLVIDQFVIIDHLELDFKQGLTILTGETGAGKSILLDAMGLVLGDPASPESIRAGEREAKIDATFTLPPTHPVWKYMVEKGAVQSPGSEFIIHRTLRYQGEDDVHVNGNTVDLEVLKKIGTFMVEIHGQFANQSLLDPANQLTLLDLSGNFPPEIFKNVADALAEVRRFTRELEEENDFLANHKREAPKIEEVVRRFEDLGMRPGFIEETKAEYDVLLRAKETSDAFQDILAQLIAANGVVQTLTAANNILTRNQHLDAEKMETLSDYLMTALENARAAVKEMRILAPEYDIDTAPIYALEEIIEGLKQIGKENKVKFDDLSAFFDIQFSKRERIRNGRDTIARLQDSLIKAKNNYRHHAHILHEKRVVAGKALSDAITSELAPLKLNRAEFRVVVEERANMPWTELGLDHVTFTARMNPGQAFSPVSDTASGGELARLILALKVVLQKVQAIPTLVFDEVDTGIGGAAAAAVGERIALLADNTQVLTITHSPQVASRSHQHLHVSKSTDGITTKSHVRQLSIDETIDEISRMLAGDVITPESRAAAQSLINEAKRAADVRQEKARQAAMAPPPEQIPSVAPPIGETQAAQ